MILDSVTLDLYRAAMNSDAFGRGREASKVLAMDKASLPTSSTSCATCSRTQSTRRRHRVPDAERDAYAHDAHDARDAHDAHLDVPQEPKQRAPQRRVAINDEADRAVEVYNFAFSYPSSGSITVAESRAQHVALDKKLTFFATVLPETTSAAAPDSLKDDDETQLDSARISPPKKKRRRGPEDHPSFLSSGIPVCSQDSVVSSRSYGDDAYLF
ncbi:hypothetical protein JL720_16130 [Aureococcus anophagefferens]|nr:hypothetical protein JL720_16130 [Aureococcus anophagefferens]